MSMDGYSAEGRLFKEPPVQLLGGRGGWLVGGCGWDAGAAQLLMGSFWVAGGWLRLGCRSSPP